MYTEIDNQYDTIQSMYINIHKRSGSEEIKRFGIIVKRCVSKHEVMFIILNDSVWNMIYNLCKGHIQGSKMYKQNLNFSKTCNLSINEKKLHFLNYLENRAMRELIIITREQQNRGL